MIWLHKGFLVGKRYKSSTNLETKLFNLEKRASRKPVKDEKYKTQKHLLDTLENNEVGFENVGTVLRGFDTKFKRCT